LYCTIYGLLQESFWNKRNAFDFLSYSLNWSFARVPRLPSWSKPRPYTLPWIPFIFLDEFFDHVWQQAILLYIVNLYDSIHTYILTYCLYGTESFLSS
jgi:hypothetical protein